MSSARQLTRLVQETPAGRTVVAPRFRIEGDVSTWIDGRKTANGNMLRYRLSGMAPKDGVSITIMRN